MKRSEIEPLLPEVFRGAARPDTPLLAILETMEALHAPSEEILGHLERFFSPREAPDAFLPMLAGWVDLARIFPPRMTATPASESPPLPLSIGPGRLRELISSAAYLSQWRGTAHGLKVFLETATGTSGFELEENVPGPDGMPHPFHIRVRAPHTSAPHRAIIERIIEQEKPAYVTFELEFAPSAAREDP